MGTQRHGDTEGVEKKGEFYSTISLCLCVSVFLKNYTPPHISVSLCLRVPKYLYTSAHLCVSVPPCSEILMHLHTPLCLCASVFRNTHAPPHTSVSLYLRVPKNDAPPHLCVSVPPCSEKRCTSAPLCLCASVFRKTIHLRTPPCLRVLLMKTIQQQRDIRHEQPYRDCQQDDTEEFTDDIDTSFT